MHTKCTRKCQKKLASEDLFSILINDSLIELPGVLFAGLFEGLVINSLEDIGPFAPAAISFHIFRWHDS